MLGVRVAFSFGEGLTRDTSVKRRPFLRPRLGYSLLWQRYCLVGGALNEKDGEKDGTIISQGDDQINELIAFS